MNWTKAIYEPDLVKISENKLLLIYNNLLRNRNRIIDLSLYSGKIGY